MPYRKPSISRRRQVALPTHLQTLCPTGEAIVALSFSPNGHFLAAALQHGAIHVFSVAPCTSDATAPPLYPHSTRILTGHVSDVLSLAFSPEGYLLASASMDHDVRVWNPARTNECLRVLKHEDMATAVAFQPISLSASSSTQSSFDGMNGTLDGESSDRASLRWLQHERRMTDSQEGKRYSSVLLSTCCDGQARAWDAISGTLLNSTDIGQVLTSVHYVSRTTAALETYDGRVLSWTRPSSSTRSVGTISDSHKRDIGDDSLLMLGKHGQEVRQQRRRVHFIPRWLRRSRSVTRSKLISLAVPKGEAENGGASKRTAIAVAAGEVSLMRDGTPVARARLCNDVGMRSGCFLGRLKNMGSRAGSGTLLCGGCPSSGCIGLSDDARVALVGATQRGGVRLADLRSLHENFGLGDSLVEAGRSVHVDVFTLRVLGRGIETNCAAIAPQAAQKLCGRGGRAVDVVMIAIAGDDGSLTIVEQVLPMRDT